MGDETDDTLIRAWETNDDKINVVLHLFEKKMGKTENLFRILFILRGLFSLID